MTIAKNKAKESDQATIVNSNDKSTSGQNIMEGFNNEIELKSVTDDQSKHQIEIELSEKSKEEEKQAAFREQKHKSRQDILHGEKIGSFHYGPQGQKRQYAGSSI